MPAIQRCTYRARRRREPLPGLEAKGKAMKPPKIGAVLHLYYLDVLTMFRVASYERENRTGVTVVMTSGHSFRWSYRLGFHE